MGQAMVVRFARNGDFNHARQMLMEFPQRMIPVSRGNPIVRVPDEFLYIGRVTGLLAGWTPNLAPRSTS